MKIEIWSDVICPWCGLGQHRLDQAVAELEGGASVTHRSFQLDPRASPTPRPAREMLAERGYPASQLDAMFARVEGLAAADGLVPYIVGDNLVANTHLAHEWLAFAAERGLEDAAWKRIYRAYFAERRPIFDVASLAALGEELGLPGRDTEAALDEHRYAARVDDDIREARALGCDGVPFVVVDRRFAIPGAQPLDVFRRVLSQARAASD